MLTTPSTRRFRRVACIAAVAAVTLAACGGDDDSDADTAPAATNEVTTAPAATSPATTVATGGGKGDYGTGDSTATTMPAAAGASGIQAGETALGSVATATDGFTMYAFMPDAQGAPTCTGECAANWPPLLVEDGATPTGADGIDASKLGTIANPEGGTQLTYGGWPLYYFAGDTAAGDTNGQGLNDVWYAMGADGSPIDDD